MKITLKFNTTESAIVAMDGWKYRSIIQHFDEWLKREIKHSEKDYQEIRDRLHETIKEYDVKIYE